MTISRWRVCASQGLHALVDDVDAELAVLDARALPVAGRRERGGPGDVLAAVEVGVVDQLVPDQLGRVDAGRAVGRRPRSSRPPSRRPGWTRLGPRGRRAPPPVPRVRGRGGRRRGGAAWARQRSRRAARTRAKGPRKAKSARRETRRWIISVLGLERGSPGHRRATVPRKKSRLPRSFASPNRLRGAEGAERTHTAPARTGGRRRRPMNPGRGSNVVPVHALNEGSFGCVSQFDGE